MYLLFLVVSAALVTLSPLGLELWLSLSEAQAERRPFHKGTKAEGPDIAWASSRLH